MTTPSIGPWNDVERLVRKISVALDEYDTETLLSMAEYQEMINKRGWIPLMIRQYIEARRTGPAP